MMLKTPRRPGSNVALAPTHARALRGVRARGVMSRNRGRVSTTITALTRRGGAGRPTGGGADRATLEAYDCQRLAPTLQPAPIVPRPANGHGRRE